MDNKTIIQIDNVRIRQYDSTNYVVEREETTENFNPRLKKKEVKTSYRFKGYYGTLTGALKAISIKGLLVDESTASELDGHLKQVEESNQKVIDAIDRMGVKANE